jgi:hypothetical protein
MLVRGRPLVYWDDEPRVPAICRTIDQVKAEFDGAGADVIPIREQASDELTDEQFEILWTVAVEQSSEIVSNSERPVEVSLLLTNLVDDLLIRGVESSYILSAVHRGFEINEDRAAEIAAEN